MVTPCSSDPLVNLQIPPQHYIGRGLSGWLERPLADLERRICPGRASGSCDSDSDGPRKDGCDSFCRIWTPKKWLQSSSWFPLTPTKRGVPTQKKDKTARYFCNARDMMITKSSGNQRQCKKGLAET